MFIRFWIKRYWMIEGSLKFHSEKMSFEKSKTRYPKNTFILLALSRNLKVFSVACDKEYDLQFISGWEVSSLEELQVLSKSCKPEDKSESSWSSDPRPGRVVWLGVETGRKCFRKCSRSIEIFRKIGITRERKVLPDLYTDHILYQLTWLLAHIRFTERCIYIY